MTHKQVQADKRHPISYIGGPFWSKLNKIFSLLIELFVLAVYFILLYTPISKNVVGEYGEWQLSNGNCTTERNCGFHINEFFAWR